ncbi:MAG: hypothetical protein C3F02_04975 [Parcubacteria group bacterium]|nr:MAG: hypothetical protein C3F02_04975 [Parcubacteria group bacterium]
MSQELEQKVIENIKEQHLKPRPRWQFLAKDYVFWGLGFLAILIGGLTFAVIIYMFLNSDWEVYSLFSDTIAVHIFTVLPYFWILFLVLFVIVAYYNLRHTNKGYVFSLPKLIGAAVGLSMLLGVFWYNLGLGYTIDNILTDNVPFYGQHFSKHTQRAHLWQRPEEGFLVGVVSERQGDTVWLNDFTGNVWRVTLADLEGPWLMEITSGSPVRLVGEVVGEDTFKALRLLPWIMHGDRDQFFNRPLPPRPERIYYNWRNTILKNA